MINGFIKLEAAHRLDAAGTKSAGEMYLKAARAGDDATVRLMDEAVRRAATADERTTAAEFAHVVLDGGAESADHIGTFEKMVVALSPVQGDARLSTSAKMAWIRSGSSELRRYGTGGGATAGPAGRQVYTGYCATRQYAEQSGTEGAHYDGR